MERKLIVAPSPHITSNNSTQKIMLDVIIALLPALALSVIFYGFNILLITLVAVISCVAFEWIIAKLMFKRATTITDLSAILTGLLLAFNLPSSIPLWLIVLGALVSIGLGKMTYGGIGQNLFNPAMVGRVFLLIAFPVQMTHFPEVSGSAEVFSGATPLSYFKEAVASGQNLQDIAQKLPLTDMISNMKNGSVGEVSSIALLCGFVYLMFRKVITWHIPIAILGTMFIFSSVLYFADSTIYLNPLTHIFAGGAILGAIYMATDYATSPMSKIGMLIYGIGIGIITMLIRVWGSYPEGISFAILILNAFVPLINMYVKPKYFGHKATKNIGVK